MTQLEQLCIKRLLPLRTKMISAKLFLMTFICLFCATLYACSTGNNSKDEELAPNLKNSMLAEVTGIVDGVTIEVRLENRIHRVRYLGIKIPSSPNEHQQNLLAADAREFNRFLVYNKTVELVRDTIDTDINGDLIRYVYVNGEMVNKALIINGHALVNSYPQQFEYLGDFLIAESNARNSRRGVWNTHAPESVQASANVGKLGSTLPSMDILKTNSQCDYTNEMTPVIKGNVNNKTGERIYHIPGTLFYDTTIIDESNGDRLFCTESEAIESGWLRSHR